MHRSLFTTKQGYLGLAPKAAREGDFLTVILGCKNPMILRQTLQQQFKVVGETYCDGLMSGEALQGPFLDNTKIVLIWDGERGFRQEFLDTERGGFRADDPRLDGIPLPLGWKVKEHRMQKWYTVFENDITKEVHEDYDPRMTVEVLKERGVAVRVFDLV